jgi:general L-amino acid transport system ATP-binding protein
MHIADEKIIEVSNLNKWFGDFQVLKEINLTVHKGERIVICGPSGSGKSTLIRCINQLEEHQQGVIKVNNIYWIIISKISKKSGPRLACVSSSLTCFHT